MKIWKVYLLRASCTYMIAIVLGRIACNQNFRFKEIAQKMAKYVKKIMIHCTECMFLLLNMRKSGLLVQDFPD